MFLKNLVQRGKNLSLALLHTWPKNIYSCTSRNNKQAILITDRLCICNHLLVKVNFWVQNQYSGCHSHLQTRSCTEEWKTRVAQNTHDPNGGRTQRCSASCLSILILFTYSFPSVLSARFCVFLCFSLVISRFKNGPQHSHKVLPSVPKHRKAMICVLDKFHSGMSYKALLAVSSVHQSMVCIK